MHGRWRATLFEVHVAGVHWPPFAAIGQMGTRAGTRNNAADTGSVHSGIARDTLDSMTPIRGRGEAQLVIVATAGLQFAASHRVECGGQRA